MTLVKLAPNAHAEIEVTILEGSAGKVAYAWNASAAAPFTIDDLLVLHECDNHLSGWTGEDLAAFSGWQMTGVGAHDLISVSPLHIEASVYWPSCCGLHGWIRDGRWTDA